MFKTIKIILHLLVVETFAMSFATAMMFFPLVIGGAADEIFAVSLMLSIFGMIVGLLTFIAINYFCYNGFRRTYDDIRKKQLGFTSEDFQKGLDDV